MAQGLCYKGRASIGHKPDIQTRRPDVDWDKFLGPAPMRPFNENRFAYNWHWFWDTGNGDIGNQGVHEMDIARWGMDVGLPNEGDMHRRTLHLERSGRNTKYADSCVRLRRSRDSFEVQNVSYINVGEIGVGNRGIQMSSATSFSAVTEHWSSKTAASRSTRARSARRSWTKRRILATTHAAHMENFLAACRSRNYKDLHADVQIGVLSADLCHLANIATEPDGGCSSILSRRSFSVIPRRTG